MRRRGMDNATATWSQRRVPQVCEPNGSLARVLLLVALLTAGLAGVAFARTQIGNFNAPEGTPTVEAYASAVSGAIVPPGQLVIDGQSLQCGRRPTVLDSRLDDYAAAFPGFIIINPTQIARVPTQVKLWIYAHECAHQFRGPDEATADCFAVQRGRRRGWLTSDGLDKICRFIEPAKGSFMHPPGPERCRLMRSCFASDKVK